MGHYEEGYEYENDRHVVNDDVAVLHLAEILNEVVGASGGILNVPVAVEVPSVAVRTFDVSKLVAVGASKQHNVIESIRAAISKGVASEAR